jgi:hypothetical protein
MPLLPYDTLVIESPLPVAEALGRLQGATGPVRWMGMGTGAHPYEGEVTEDEVSIRRAIGYQNSFLPRIQGRLEPAGQGSRLAATMEMHPLVMLIMSLWMAIALTTALPMLVLAATSDPPVEFVLLPVGMLLAGWALASGAFTIEARIARRELTALLDGRIAADAAPSRAV